MSRTVTCTVHTVRVPAPQNHSQHYQCRTSYAAAHTLVLLMMGIMMPEMCWDKSLMINIRLVASCWFLSLHPTFMTQGHKSLYLACTSIFAGTQSFACRKMLTHHGKAILKLVHVFFFLNEARIFCFCLINIGLKQL